MSDVAIALNSRDQKIRYRVTIRQRWLMILMVPLMFITIGVVQVLAPPHVVAYSWLFWYAAVYIPVSVFVYYVGGVTLTPTHLRIHNLRRRSIAWNQVRWVGQEKFFFNNTIVVIDQQGHQTRLRAPITGPFWRDPLFDEKFQTIGRWYLQQRDATD